MFFVVPGNPQLDPQARLIAVTAFGGLAARSLWSAYRSYTAPPMLFGSEVNARGRIILFTRGERTGFIGTSLTIVTSGLTVLLYPPGAPPTFKQWAIALILYAFGLLFAVAMVFMARQRRKDAVASAWARFDGEEALKEATPRE